MHISDVMEFMGDQLEVGQGVTFELGQDPKEPKDESRKRENITWPSASLPNYEGARLS